MPNIYDPDDDRDTPTREDVRQMEEKAKRDREEDERWCKARWCQVCDEPIKNGHCFRCGRHQ